MPLLRNLDWLPLTRGLRLNSLVKSLNLPSLISAHTPYTQCAPVIVKYIQFHWIIYFSPASTSNHLISQDTGKMSSFHKTFFDDYNKDNQSLSLQPLIIIIFNCHCLYVCCSLGAEYSKWNDSSLENFESCQPSINTWQYMSRHMVNVCWIKDIPYSRNREMTSENLAIKHKRGKFMNLNGKNKSLCFH